jgi:hypothetical protein
MEIIINDEKVDFTVENEKNLGDVLESLEGWVAENGGIINNVSVDEREITVGQQSEHLEKNISAINRLSLQTSTRFDHALSTIGTVSVYIDRVIGEYLKSRNIDDYELILEGINLIAEGIDCSLGTLCLRSMVVVNNKGKSLTEILHNLRRLIDLYEKQYVDGDGWQELQEVLTELQQLLPKVVNWAVLKNSLYDVEVRGLEVSFLKTALVDLESIAIRTMDKFEKIGENLQVGRDGEAMGDLLFVTEIMDEIIYVLQFFMTAYSMDSTALSKSDLNMDELFAKFSAGLKEIENSFRSEDLITVGDMLEYEIKPLFQAMIDLLRRVGVFIQ